MAYIFQENKLAVSRNGINIYHLYHFNHEDAGVLKFNYTTDKNGTSDSNGAFDIREIAGFQNHLTPIENLEAMIDSGVFYSNTQSHEDSSKEYICPLCHKETLKYGGPDITDDGIIYPWECKHCGATGIEVFTRHFEGHENVNLELDTPRGTLPITRVFDTASQAKAEGYGYYFTEGNTDIYVYHLDAYHVKFGILKKF